MTVRRKELAFVGPCEYRRLPVMRVRWLEECEGRRHAPKILEMGYRAGLKPGNHGRRFPPEPLTPEEVLRLIATVPNGKVGVRNRALIALLWRTGLRIECEALRLLPHHVDFQAKRVTVLCGKGSKRRIGRMLRSGEGSVVVSDDPRAFQNGHGAFAFRCRSGCHGRCMTNHSGQRNVPWQVRFWNFVPDPRPHGCWEWTGWKEVQGYGRLTVHRPNVMKAHRASWIIHNGPIPDGLVVCHRCDNPPCVNPEHLFLGTRTDNNADKVTKGRNVSPRGEASGNARYTDDEIRTVRQLAAFGKRPPEITRLTGVGLSCVRHVLAGRTRKEAV